MTDKPTHAYILVHNGIVTGIVADLADKQTAEWVAESIAQGNYVVRMPIRTASGMLFEPWPRATDAQPR